MKKYLYFTLAIVCYLLGTGGLFYFIAWVGDFAPFMELNGPAESTPVLATLKNAALITLFGLQHSIMARQSFKQKWLKIIPKALERSIFVLISGALCFLIAWQWSPIEGSLWNFEVGTSIYFISYACYFAGIVVLLASSFLINHFELFGLQQAYQYLKGKKGTDPKFTDVALYKVTRHPIYLGVFMFIWFTPNMTVTHLMLAGFVTIYIYIGVYFEERDLVKTYGQTYMDYKDSVPKLIPNVATSRTAPKMKGITT